jgi:hypothetical protein
MPVCAEEPLPEGGFAKIDWDAFRNKLGTMDMERFKGKVAFVLRRSLTLTSKVK